MTTVCFILNSIRGIHGIRRVEEFIEHGFSVRVFGFNRGENSKTKLLNYNLEIVGTIENSMPYAKRLPILKNGIRQAKKLVGNEKVLWYYLGMDVAIAAKLYNRSAPYIYEEADLVYTYLKNNFLKFVFKKLDKNIISHSVKTILTSDGFVQYLYKNKQPQNVVVLTNRLAKEILTLPVPSHRTSDVKSLTFGFVGGVRFQSICSFIKTVVKNFPQHKVLVYGVVDENCLPQIEELKKCENFSFLGRFTNPYDLPSIYSAIDLIISTYDVKFDNVKIAEPNKLYEAIYFETPIIATRGTFLASKIEKIGVGFAIDPLQESEIIQFVNNLTVENLQLCKNNCKRISKSDCVNDNSKFLFDLKQKISQL